MIVAPPLDVGAVNATSRLPFPRVMPVIVGDEGVPEEADFAPEGFAQVFCASLPSTAQIWNVIEPFPSAPDELLFCVTMIGEAVDGPPSVLNFQEVPALVVYL